MAETDTYAILPPWVYIRRISNAFFVKIDLKICKNNFTIGKHVSQSVRYHRKVHMAQITTYAILHRQRRNTPFIAQQGLEMMNFRTET